MHDVYSWCVAPFLQNGMKFYKTISNGSCLEFLKGIRKDGVEIIVIEYNDILVSLDLHEK